MVGPAMSSMAVQANYNNNNSPSGRLLLLARLINRQDVVEDIFFRYRMTIDMVHTLNCAYKYERKEKIYLHLSITYMLENSYNFIHLL